LIKNSSSFQVSTNGCFLIYRRDAENPANIAGQVEFVGREETLSFGGTEELMEILVGSKRRKVVQKSKRASQRAKTDTEGVYCE
jgi:hypothetical protein